MRRLVEPAPSVAEGDRMSVEDGDAGDISNCRFCSFRRNESLGRKGNVPVVVGIP
ncbi:MAG: hypothetical protein LBK18_07805 [Prevotellaceae bacterium]|nr:hypothetical protein [Prevotellaceae bacterium]